MLPGHWQLPVPGARLKAGVDVRISAAVYANTTLPTGTTVPIAWVAAGDPAQILSPGRHDDIRAIQQHLDSQEPCTAPPARPRRPN
jgi:hypothetical protein